MINTTDCLTATEAMNNFDNPQAMDSHWVWDLEETLNTYFSEDTYFAELNNMDDRMHRGA